MPRNVFLLGPNEWDDNVHPPAPLWMEQLLGQGPRPYTPLHLRRAAAVSIERESGGLIRGVIMDRADQKPGEPDDEFFHRLEVQHNIAAYYITFPLPAKVLGTVFEGGMLVRDFHHGQRPHIVLLLQAGFAAEDTEGNVTFTAKGKRTDYLRSLVKRAQRHLFWHTEEELVELLTEQVLADAGM